MKKSISENISVVGTVVSGHRVASGQADSSPYPAGTIAMQTPHFQSLGVDLSPFYPGTLNVSISPHQFKLVPAHTLLQVKWSPHHDAESFSFTPIYLRWQEQSYSGLVYYPHPETKINHFQNPSVIELLMPHIPDIAYGSSVVLTASSRELIIKE